MERDVFDNLSPLDHRYYVSNPELVERLAACFSENANVRYMLKVEAALARVLAERGVCPRDTADEIEQACANVCPEEVYQEEEKTQHNVRALTNCIARRISDCARPYVHFTATSVDVLDTANAMRFRDANREVVIPVLLRLERVLIDLARREKDCPQVGRTHGQHAVPITFGFAVAEYVARLGERIEFVQTAGENLRGKMAGAVGAYSASALIFEQPEEFERDVLSKLELKPGSHSTQIVAPEFLLDYLHGVASAFGVLANLADDFRHLQRSELSEVSETFGAAQVGSSTMPHKRNPWNFEHVKSLWKEFMPRMATVYMDQISEHQRDLTNSASGRFAPEMVAGLVLAADRLIRVMSRIVVDHEHMEHHLQASSARFVAEPLYILLAAAGHPDAHEAVRRLTLKADETGTPLLTLMAGDPELAPYQARFSERGRAVLADPRVYLGTAARKTAMVCDEWEERLFSPGTSGA